MQTNKNIIILVLKFDFIHNDKLSCLLLLSIEFVNYLLKIYTNICYFLKTCKYNTPSSILFTDFIKRASLSFPYIINFSLYFL
jgi:hypothetical protein